MDSNTSDFSAALHNMITGLPVPGGMSERLWRDCQPEVQESLQHPFVLALAHGTLPRSSFQHYIAQDAHFLSHFAQAYAAAMDKCTTDPQNNNQSNTPNNTNNNTDAPNGCEALPVLSELLLRVHTELRMHGGYAAQWGVEMKAGFKPSAATRAYTDFLMEVAQDPQASVAEVLAAMIPCSRLYGYLGCQLAAAAAAAAAPRHAYSEWIDVYSGAEYLASPIMKEELFDKICHKVPYERLRDLYRRAMQLEVNFFSAQPGTPRPRHVALLVCDFDDTLTCKDTIGALLNAAVEANVKASKSSDADSLRQQLSAKVKKLSENYVHKQQQLLATLLPQDTAAAAASDGTTAGAAPKLAEAKVTSAAAAAADGAGTPAAAAQPYDGAGLMQFCESLSDFDVDMNQVVIDAGVLRGLSQSDITAAAQAIQLRPGVNKILATATAAGLPVAVVSVNWSKTLVQAALKPPAAAAAVRDLNAQQQQQQGGGLELHTNELMFDDRGFSTGGLSVKIQNGRDKARVMDQLIQKYRPGSSSSSSGGGGSGAVVYVGDSASDIPPLLKADYGIVIGHNKLLRRVLSTYGVQLLPLCSAPLEPPSSSSSGSSGGPVLYTAENWEQISAFLFGPTPYDTNRPLGSNTTAAAAGSNGQQQQQQRGYGSAVSMRSGLTAASLAAAAAAAAAGGVDPPPVLTIAGSDSGGGAGIQADLKTIMANGGFGMSALTALTAQNTTGVQAIHTPPQSFLEQQLDSIFSDLKPLAVKTGMLPDAATVMTVARKIQQYAAAAAARSGSEGIGIGGSSSSSSSRGLAPSGSGSGLVPLVVDPVMISTSGHALTEGSVRDALRDHLIPLATVITPNLTEAQVLLGSDQPITTLDEMRAAAAALHKLGCHAVLIKGGHLAEQQQQQQQSSVAAAAAAIEAVDILYDGNRFYYYSAPYIQTANTHGTGCTLAAAIATALAHGQPPVEAVQSAKDYLTLVLAGSKGLGLGVGPQHPFHHGVRFSRVDPGSLNPSQGLVTTPGLKPNPNPNPQALVVPNSRTRKTPDGLNPIDLRMYVVTDPGCNKRAGRTLIQAVQGAVAGGATVVQLREKDIDGGDFVREARAVVQLCRPLGIPVIINDRVDVAIASDADGVHVGQSDIPARLVRKMLGPDKILGVSTKTPAETAKAVADGADYVGVGAVFPTSTKDSSVVGLEGLRAACAIGIPAVAIGGVGIHNAGEVLATGVQGLAVVSAVFAAPDVEAATRQLRDAVDLALQQQGQQQQQSCKQLEHAAVVT